MNKIVIGARGSKLSLTYVDKVKKIISKVADVHIEIKKIKTTGDIETSKKLSEIGGKKLFCKEIEENLISNNIDIAVHALKDMEANEHQDLVIGAYLERNDPRDVIIGKNIKKLKDLNKNLTLGSSSRRRMLQLKRINKNISVINLRGNIDTRIKNLVNQKLDGIMLAAAGVKSLNLESKISLTFESSDLIPAVGQGVIAVQCRRNDEKIKEILNKINNKESFICAQAERSLLKTIGGDCDTAIGGLAEIKDKNLILKTELFSDDGLNCFKYDLKGGVAEAIDIGKATGEKLLSLAGTKFKKK